MPKTDLFPQRPPHLKPTDPAECAREHTVEGITGTDVQITESGGMLIMERISPPSEETAGRLIGRYMHAAKRLGYTPRFRAGIGKHRKVAEPCLCEQGIDFADLDAMTV